MDKKRRKEFTKKAQMVFQDPYSSLNPCMTVEDIVGTGMKIHKLYTGNELSQRISDLLSLVGLNPKIASRFPHEFSGGQRQRICIARALAVNPEFLVCDEPISALDVSIQAQIVNLIRKLQQELHLTNLFIAHDLNMVRYVSNRIMVAYLGNIMEIGDSCEICDTPAHPYSRILLDAVPIPDPVLQQSRPVTAWEGDMPSPMAAHKGCVFALRCPCCEDRCRELKPNLKEVDTGHFVACHKV